LKLLIFVSRSSHSVLKMLSLLALGSEDALLAMDSSELAELVVEEGFDESEYHLGVEFNRYCCVAFSWRW
jgi:hypothetical protein